MAGVSRRHAVAAAGAAWAGLVLGHFAAYLAAYPSRADRAAHLVATGHDWLATVAVSTVVAGAVALAATIRGGLREGPGSPGRTAILLVSLQVPAFALIELAERGFDVAAASGDPGFLAGLIIQVAVGAGAAVLLDLIARGTRSVAARLRRPPVPVRPVRRAPPPSLLVAPPPDAFLIGARRRAPPVSSTT
jgi:hypothetical protein